MTIGEKIKQLREAKHLSQEQLATLMGYKSRSTINKIELGKNDVSQSTIKKFATIFMVSPSELISEDTVKMKVEESRLFSQIQSIYGKDVTDAMKLLLQLAKEDQLKAISYMEDLKCASAYRDNDLMNRKEG